MKTTELELEHNKGRSRRMEKSMNGHKKRDFESGRMEEI
jgi:hypothetical protein